MCSSARPLLSACESDSLAAAEQRVGATEDAMKDSMGKIRSSVDRRRHAPRVATLVLAGVFCCLAGESFAETSAEAWRRRVAETRVLAENDAPAAYREAQRLQTELPADAAPEDRVRALNLLARIQNYLAQTDLAAQRAHEALALAEKSGDRAGRVEADLNLALITINQGDIPGLVESTTDSLSAIDGVDRPDLLGEALLRNSMRYLRFGQLDESVAMSMRAMDIARHSKLPLTLAYAHQGLGISFGQTGSYEQAREQFLQLRDDAQAAHSTLLEADALNSLGFMAGNLGDLRGGEKLLRQAVELYRQVGGPFYVNFGTFGVAANLRMQKRPAEALPLLEQVLAGYVEHPNRIGRWYTTMALSETQEELGHVAQAQTLAEQAYALARDIEFSSYIADSARRMAKLAADAGDYRRAYQFGVEAQDMGKRAALEKSGPHVIDLTQRYERESRQREIDDLTRRNELQTAALQTAALRQRWLWTVAAASVLAVAGAGVFLWRQRRSHRQLEGLNGQLRQSQDNVQRQTDILQSILDSMGDGVAVAGRDGKLILMNPAGRQILGAGDAVLGSDQLAARFSVFLPDRDTLPADEQLPLRRALDGESSDDVLMLLRNDGLPAEGRWLSASARPLLDHAGAAQGGVVVFSDISKRKRAEDEVQALNANLEARVLARTAELERAQLAAEAATRAKSEFLANMSHEIRTPMNAILGMSYLALQAGLEPQQRDQIGKVHRCAESLLGIVNDILDFSKIEAGRLDLESIPFELDDVAESFATLVGMKADEKGLELLVDLQSALPPLLGDPMRLSQVLLNLGNNAVKFTERGQVLLHIEQAARGDAAIALRFSMSDTGMGIQADRLQDMFKPFSQGDASTSRRFGGTGLGLAISRQLVCLMGGDIGAESTPGVGSCFRFELELPLAPVAAKALLQASPLVEAEGRVLVVDDNASGRDIARRLALACGFQADAAPDGPAALRALAAADLTDAPYTLLLLDARMPGMDGVECARRVATAACRRPPAVVMMCGMFHQHETMRRLQAERLVVGAMLTKPVTQAALAVACARALGLGDAESAGVAPGDAALLANQAQVRGARVLLVEDNAINQELACQLLSRAGVDVRVAADGQEALDVLAEQSFDAVLMDCQMPVMDGYAATQALRLRPELAAVPVIAMTANAMTGDIERAHAAGMNDHIAKPIRVDAMFETLARWVHPAPAGGPAPRADGRYPVLPALPGIDAPAVIDGLDGDVEFYVRLLSMFRDSQGDFVARFEAAWAAGEEANAMRLVHTLKGVAGSLGAHGVYESASRLESALLGGSPQKTSDVLLDELRQKLDVVIHGLRALDGDVVLPV